MRRGLVWVGKFAVVLLVGAAGAVIDGVYRSAPVVHAQDKNEGSICMVAVPKSWGEYKGASTYGLAFQDGNGTLRFLLHPICGNLNSPADEPLVDLKILRQ